MKIHALHHAVSSTFNDNVCVTLFKRVAEDLGCDDKTIRNIASEFVDSLNAEYKPVLPRVVGMDETTIDGKLRFIVTDLVDRKPIDMLIDREKSTVSDYL